MTMADAFNFSNRVDEYHRAFEAKMRAVDANAEPAVLSAATGIKKRLDPIARAARANQDHPDTSRHIAEVYFSAVQRHLGSDEEAAVYFSDELTIAAEVLGTTRVATTSACTEADIASCAGRVMTAVETALVDALQGAFVTWFRTVSAESITAALECCCEDVERATREQVARDQVLELRHDLRVLDEQRLDVQNTMASTQAELDRLATLGECGPPPAPAATPLSLDAALAVNVAELGTVEAQIRFLRGVQALATGRGPEIGPDQWRRLYGAVDRLGPARGSGSPTDFAVLAAEKLRAARLLSPVVVDAQPTGGN
jgi:hypothetical protein